MREEVRLTGKGKERNYRRKKCDMEMRMKEIQDGDEKGRESEEERLRKRNNN